MSFKGLVVAGIVGFNAFVGNIDKVLAQITDSMKIENQTQKIGMEIIKSRQQPESNNSKNKEDIYKQFPVQDVTKQGIDMKGKDFKFEEGYMYYRMGDTIFKILAHLQGGNYEIREKLDGDLEPVIISDDGETVLILLFSKTKMSSNSKVPHAVKAISVDKEGIFQKVYSLYILQSFVKTGKYLVMLGDAGNFSTEEPVLMIYDQEDGSMTTYSMKDVESILWQTLNTEEKASNLYKRIIKIKKGKNENELLFDYDFSDKKNLKSLKALDIDRLIHEFDKLKDKRKK